jgi:hypothetical protein
VQLVLLVPLAPLAPLVPLALQAIPVRKVPWALRAILAVKVQKAR